MTFDRGNSFGEGPRCSALPFHPSLLTGQRIKIMSATCPPNRFHGEFIDYRVLQRVNSVDDSKITMDSSFLHIFSGSKIHPLVVQRMEGLT